MPKSYVLRTFAGCERNNPNGYELLQIHYKYFSWGVLAKNKGIPVGISILVIIWGHRLLNSTENLK